jgi:phospholipid transport system substrate-binding protein
MTQVRMTLRVAVAAALLLVGAATPALAFAAPQGASSFIEHQHQTVREILQRKSANADQDAARKRDLASALQGLLDFEELSRRALVDHWTTLTPTQQQEFVSLLRQLVERNYQRNMESTLDFQITYSDEIKGGDGIVVQTVARSRKNRRAPEVSIDYTLVAKDSGYRVFDVVTDGVSLVTNYRTQFNRIIRKDGWDKLIERMRARLSSDNNGVL